MLICIFLIIFSLCSNDVCAFHWELVSAFPYFSDRLQPHSLQAQISTEILHLVTLPFALPNRKVAECKMKKLMSGDKVREITCQLSPEAKQKINLFRISINT